jgi:uncharacterized protein (TIGR02246 family)
MDKTTAAVHELYHELLTAWNDRDARRFAKLFADDGSLIGFDGTQVSASDAETHLVPIFADHPTARYVWKVHDVRPLSDTTVLLQARVGMVPPGKDDLNPALNAVQSLVAVQREGTWHVTLFQNTPAQYHGRPDLAEKHTAEMREVLATKKRT